MSYWLHIPWLQINGKDAPYGVYNEREIRATAGTMMLIGFITFVIVYTTKDYTYLYPTVILFWLQFFIASVWWAERAPISRLARWMVSKQKPEYVWAIQKRFAWSMGLAMATAMLIVTALLWMKGAVPFSICMVCLFFMWMESALGICVWCKIYYGLIGMKWLKEPHVRPACPGGACEVTFGNR